MDHIVNRKNLALFTLVVLLTLFGCVFKVHASAYLIYLYYIPQDKTLDFDRKSSNNIVLDENIHPDYLAFAKKTEAGEYLLKLFDINDIEIINTEFNKSNGAFVLQIPYFSLANKLKIIEKASNKELLQADLSKYLTCNGNGICEFEKGETSLNCIGDCANSNTIFSEQTKKELKNNGGAIKDNAGKTLLTSSPEQNNTETMAKSSGKTTLFVLIFSVFVLVGAISFLLYKKFFRKDQDV